MSKIFQKKQSGISYPFLNDIRELMKQEEFGKTVQGWMKNMDEQMVINFFLSYSNFYCYNEFLSKQLEEEVVGRLSEVSDTNLVKLTESISRNLQQEKYASLISGIYKQ